MFGFVLNDLSQDLSVRLGRADGLTQILAGRVGSTSGFFYGNPSFMSLFYHRQFYFWVIKIVYLSSH